MPRRSPVDAGGVRPRSALVGGGLRVSDVIDRAIARLIDTRDTAGVYRTLLEATREATDADEAKFAVTEWDDLVFRYSATEGRLDPDPDRRVPIPSSVFGHAIETGDPRLIDDLSMVRSAADSGDADAPCPTVRSMLIFPVDDLGVVVAGDAEPGAFTETHVTDLERLLGYGRVALEATEPGGLPSSTTELLEEIASVVSHDVMTPLQIATGRIQLARQTGEEGHLDEAEGALERLHELLETVVTLARTGTHVETLSTVPIEAAVDRVWSNLDVAGATCRVETTQAIHADENCLYQILENLFRNAIVHAGEGVAIRVGGLDDGFFIEDDGPGIPADEREAVFEWGHTSSDSGTGVGLSIVRRLAEAHGWSVAATEADSGGARFEIRGVEFADAP